MFDYRSGWYAEVAKMIITVFMSKIILNLFRHSCTNSVMYCPLVGPSLRARGSKLENVCRTRGSEGHLHVGYWTQLSIEILAEPLCIITGIHVQ